MTGNRLMLVRASGGNDIPDEWILQLLDERELLLTAVRRLVAEAFDPVQRPCWQLATEAIRKAETA
jgi:hypothetical protein